MDEPTVEQQLRDAITAGDWSINALAKSAGVPQPTLHRWWTTSGASLALRHVNAVCRVLGLELRRKGRRR